MKIHIASATTQSLGGGFTFRRNFEKYAKQLGHEIVDTPNGADIFFIAGATMVTREQVTEAKRHGLKIVLRVDNVPRNSRNRNTGTSRLYDFAQMADLVIYQSEWAKSFIMPFIKKDGAVILNGADTDIFNTSPTLLGQPKEGELQFLYLQYNRDETKQWHQAWYSFIKEFEKNNKAHLWIVGNFSQENVEYNFDFFMGEKFRYVGVLENPADIAEYLRGADVVLLPYYNDACSNTHIEALLCGAEVIHNSTGGAEEIEEAFKANPNELSAEIMTIKYLDQFKKLL